ncbi:hypothetical protein Vi05172_g1264 [Venturia inaequalis]|nr:hypothetical protein Vi05172_g1264 [Venturia inaequalis]
MDSSPVLAVLRPRATETPSDTLLKLLSDPFHAQIQETAFLASLATSIGMTFAIALLFCFLRPLNTTVYAPRLKHADSKHAPPPIAKTPWAWLSVVMKEKEKAMIEKVGLDGAIFIRFTHMCRNIFLVLSVIGCGILLPVNIIVGGKQFAKGNTISTLSRMTPQFMIGPVFWWLVICAWLIDIVVCFFLWTNYRTITRLRREFFESADYQGSLSSRTLMVTAIPKTSRTDEGLERIVDEIKHTSVRPRAAIARNVRELPDLIEEHEDNVIELEKVLAKYLKNPDKLPAKRPMTTVHKKDPAYVKGQKVDAINHLTSRIQVLEGRIRKVRGSVDQRDAMSYGFASYETVEEAHGVAYTGRSKHPQGSTIRLAPRPSDIIWKNLGMTKKTRRRNTTINQIYVFILTLFWTVANAFLAIFLANLANLGALWKTFDTELRKDPNFWAVVQGVASPAITSAFYFFLPIIFRRLSIRSGDLTKTSRERHVVSKLYAFFVFNNLIIFSLFGALWSFAAAIISARGSGVPIATALESGDIFNKVMVALCNVSPFWITWLLQRNLGAAIDLSQFVNLAWGSFARRFLSPTPRELIKLTAPPPFDYASYYNYFLFYMTVALCFATLQPLVLPVTAFYFIVDSYLKKYLIMYVFVTKTESGGQFWRVLFNRVLFAAFLSNIIVACLVKAKAIGLWVNMFAAMAPLPFLLIGFKFYCKRTFDDQIHYYTKGIMDKENTVAPDQSRRDNQVASRFGHPSLYKPLMTPMVHSKAQHMLSQIYQGRLDTDDTADLAGFSDTYSLRDMKKGTPGKQAAPRGPFEFVSETDMDFENYKNRDDFRSEFGGDGEMYGRPEDLVRSGTPLSHRPGNHSHVGINPAAGRFYGESGSHSRSQSRDSERTLSDGQGVGVSYPAGYHQTPSSGLRGYDPSPDRSGLVQGAAPMGAAQNYRGAPSGTHSQSSTPLGTPGDDHATSYDYFRGRGR